MNIVTLVTPMLLSLMFVACRHDGFQGSSPTNPPQPQPQPQPKPQMSPKPQEAVNPMPPASCTQAKLLGIKSLKNFVDQRQPNPTIDAELTFEPCPAQQGNSLLPVRFDLDARLEFEALDWGITYELIPQGGMVNRGNLRWVVGSDLFSKVGTDYGYFEASSPMSVTPTITTAILKISLASIKVVGRVNGAVETQNFQMPLHIKVGDALPATGTITFTPAR